MQYWSNTSRPTPQSSYAVGEAGEWITVSNQNSPGFQTATYAESLTFTFDAATAQFWKFTVTQHPSSESAICVGLAELEIHGVLQRDGISDLSSANTDISRNGRYLEGREFTFKAGVEW